jgi:hypothetical protein
MARGFESKSVESQQADLEERRRTSTDAAPPAEDPAIAARRRTLAMARARAVADRARAHVPAHIEMLAAAVTAIDQQLAALPAHRIE